MMKGFIFKYGILSVLIVSGLLVVCAFAFPRFFASSEAAVTNGPQNSWGSRPRNIRPRSFENKATDVPEAEYQARLARIRQFKDAGNFEDLVKEGDEIQAVWAANGGERYGTLTVEVIHAFGYSRIRDGHPEVRGLSEKYAIVALERADSFSLESETTLLMTLGYFPDLPSLNDEEATKLRNSSKLWLHLFSRLERERDPAADPYLALQKQLEAPENPHWGDRSPDKAAIAKFEEETKVYYEKRKWLGDQYKLRNLASDRAEPWGTKFLANVYSRPPFSREELRSLLSQYRIADNLRKRILKSRDDLVRSVSQ